VEHLTQSKTESGQDARDKRLNLREKDVVNSIYANNLEVGGPNTSKRTALLWLTDQLGVSHDELMCCGDAPNDMAMLELAGIGVAVANAWGGLKDHADYITDSNDDDGVAAAVEKFVLKR
jgi:hydroxymethylpyrimidine pyrophosphatase-like HAD family hydrolase